MKTELTFEQYPAWFIILCVGLGVAYAALLYFRDRTFKDQLPSIRPALYGMTALRFLAVTVISFLLLAPWIRSKALNEIQPVIVILQDNSESITTLMSESDSTAYVTSMKNAITALEENYEVMSFSFGDNLIDGMDYQFDQQSTNFSSALDELSNRIYNLNVGAVVIASDGIYNTGTNPAFTSIAFSSSVYTIALGDTSAQTDLKIRKVFANKIAYLDDRFKVEVEIEAQNLEATGQKAMVKHISSGGTVELDDQTFDIENSSTIKLEFVIDANEIGLQHYRIDISQFPEEVTYANNSADFFVEVLDSRQKILIVMNAPHPDVSAIQQAVGEQKNYDVQVIGASEANGAIDEYNLVILHQLPSRNYPVSSLTDALKEKGVPALFILGTQSDLSKFKNAQNAIGIESRDGFSDVTAHYVEEFSLFTLDEDTRYALQQFPPLASPFADYSPTTSGSTLLRQKIGNIETDDPLIVFSDQLGVKSGVITGEGIWRWRLYDYLNNGNHNASNEIINKSIQYLAVKSDKRQFRVSLSKNVFMENELVEFEAQLYNESYELVNSVDVDLMITDQDGQEFPRQFLKTQNAYRLNAGFLPVGDYTYTASTQLNGKAYDVSGEFTVSSVQLEELETVADHQTLFALSRKFGGSVVDPEQIPALISEIKQLDNVSPVIEESYRSQAIINLKWIFFTILALISLEWFLRKFYGAY